MNLSINAILLRTLIKLFFFSSFFVFLVRRVRKKKYAKSARTTPPITSVKWILCLVWKNSSRQTMTWTIWMIKSSTELTCKLLINWNIWTTRVYLMFNSAHKMWFPTSGAWMVLIQTLIQPGRTLCYKQQIFTEHNINIHRNITTLYQDLRQERW